MITTHTITVTCDACGEIEQINTETVCKVDDWKKLLRFANWNIDWTGPNGDALCPVCKDKEE